jgi:hypothetical protein
MGNVLQKTNRCREWLQPFPGRNYHNYPNSDRHAAAACSEKNPEIDKKWLCWCVCNETLIDSFNILLRHRFSISCGISRIMMRTNFRLLLSVLNDVLKTHRFNGR